MELKENYLNRKQEFETQFDKQRSLLRRSSLIRFMVFAATAAAIYFLWGTGVWAGIAAVVGLGIFLKLVARHEKLKRKRDHLAALIHIQELEIRVLDRDFYDLPDGTEFSNPNHEYSHDIDLYGKGSLFQYINRTELHEGAVQLSRLLENRFGSSAGDSNELTAESIKNRQAAIDELAGKIDYRHDFRASASLLDSKERPAVIDRWVSDYEPFVPSVFTYLSWVLLAVNVVLIALYAFDLISGWWVAGSFFLGLAITARYVKQINQFSVQVSKLESFFTQYGQLIGAIESEEFSASYLQKLQNRLLCDGKMVSARLMQLGELISRLDQRNNMLFGVLANGLGLWDLYQCRKIEGWLDENRQQVGGWLDTVALFEAMHSCGNHACNHPQHCYPTITAGDFHLTATGAYHPLLDPVKAVGNDLKIASGEFFIITGANMAGKSTFLRTISTHIVLANIGLPICATDMNYSPIRLITSMRTSDSLSDEASYFFSELTRLKYIVDKIEDQPYFIVLDEILKGTNSQDKANGSRRLLEKLSRKSATGIIATHDLSLTEVADEFENISNYYFDADITNDVLTFDYTMKPGVATNMNASFLLRHMGIVDE